MKISISLFLILFLCTDIKGIIDPSALPPEEDTTSQPPQEEPTEGPSQPIPAQYPLQYPAKIYPPGYCLSYEEMVNLTNEFCQNISELLTTPRNCGGTPGWRRVAYLDMTDPSQSCPPGLDLKTYSSGVRACGIGTSLTDNCWSTFYMTGDAEYSRVCGRVRGYQFSEAYAFSSRNKEIDSHYVSGVSLTHGQSGSRTHIWTFAASFAEVIEDQRNLNLVCPCVSDSSTSPPPDFVGNDYFCESGTETWTGELILYADDPLWDGLNCGPNSCCEFNNPPYFTKTLPTPTTDDIELRICSLGLPTESPIDQVEIYVK